MSHIVVEYSANLAKDARMNVLLKRLVDTMIAQKDETGKAVYPIGGLRARAIKYDDYCIADGNNDYCFVHVAVKIGAGRSEAIEAKTKADLFEALKDHYADAYARRLLALSLEFGRFSEEGTLKHNNLHAYFKAKAGKT